MWNHFEIEENLELKTPAKRIMRINIERHSPSLSIGRWNDKLELILNSRHTRRDDTTHGPVVYEAVKIEVKIEAIWLGVETNF